MGKHEVAQNESRPPRKYYTLTREGEHALTDAARRYRLLEKPRRARVGRPLRERG
jgi:DNA-binding PadR family transcriptional regulator